MSLAFVTTAEYVPGTPGGAWTDDEIDTVRQKVLRMLDPRKKKETLTDFADDELVWWAKYGPVSENALLRLSFHDCTRYKDGSGGCDGCLNWKGMGFTYTTMQSSDGNGAGYYPENKNRAPIHSYPPVQEGDNNKLDRLVFYLEKIYTDRKWPKGAPKLKKSLKESGKSRADFWQFAANVALERTIERANYACRHDYNSRQQIPLLEDEGKGLEYGIWKCNIKLTKPFKFQYGRADCVPHKKQKMRPYKATKNEAMPKVFASAEEILQGVKMVFGMTARDLIALTGVHGLVAHPGENTLGTKYAWFGASYLSNMYYKMIVNRPTYANNEGSDMLFDPIPGDTNPTNIMRTSIGDADGNPVATWGWKVGCSDLWNTKDNGPCVMRPTKIADPGNPTLRTTQWDCYDGIDTDGKIKVKDKFYCDGAYFTKLGIQKGARPAQPGKTGFNNMFALPYEIGLYYKFSVREDTGRAYGCPGIDDDVMDFPFENDGKSWGIFRTSDTMQCEKNDYVDEDGTPIYQIVEEYADDHDVWASDFLDAWQRMQSNGYTDLKNAPESSWLGYYSLTQQGINLGNAKSNILYD